MTRKEIINEIKCLLSELDNGEDAVSYLTRNDVKWLNENIKALEQEPTDKKFTKADIDAIVKAINKGWELRVNEVLDKIKAEIVELQKEYQEYGWAYDDMLEIIDKYKAETEE